MGGLLHLVQPGGAWAGCGHAQFPLGGVTADVSSSKYYKRLSKEPVLVCKWLYKQPVVCLDHCRFRSDIPLPLHMHTAVCHWSMALSMMPSVNASARQCRVSVFV